ncbi:MAG: CHAT domain-containing protein, partial [Saprospiraceae bacterium]
QMIFAMRDRSPNDGFRDWMGDDMDIVANLAEVRQGMYTKTGDKKYVESAFEAIEASKTFAMQQFLHETYALHWGGLSDSLFQQETEYRQQIIDLETNFFMVRLQPNADSLIAANDQELFALRDQYGVFLTDLEQHYPEYFRLKYSHPAVDLQQVQKQILHPGQCLLDLYIRNDLVFALLLRPDTMVWLTTPYDSLGQQAIELLESDSRHFADYQQLPEKEYLRRLQAYADASHRVYQLLIEPLKPWLTEEILLIPRNELATLPFGALLTQKETNLGKPFLWHFLDNEFVISQAFSIGLFQFVQSRPTLRQPTGSVLALAPFFENKVPSGLQLPVGDVATLTRDDVFNPLPNSGEEALAIAGLTKGEALIGAQATRANFLAKSPAFKILHLATHSAANDVLGEYSFVALQGENASQKIDLLYARDIYGLCLSADLVVLSACETALGQYRNGEGIIGLTRAFTCAGVRNVVASLWSVNDASTKGLMILFYQEIKKGLPYNRALANAKRIFIRENRQYAYPYYWAGFVLNGR